MKGAPHWYSPYWNLTSHNPTERKKQKGQGNSSPMAPDFDMGSDSQSDSNSDRPFFGAKPEDEVTTDDDASLDDFIAEDDGNAAEVTLPAQFRAAQHLSVHFKVVCQCVTSCWLLHRWLILALKDTSFICAAPKIELNSFS